MLDAGPDHPLATGRLDWAQETALIHCMETLFTRAAMDILLQSINMQKLEYYVGNAGTSEQFRALVYWLRDHPDMLRVLLEEICAGAGRYEDSPEIAEFRAALDRAESGGAPGTVLPEDIAWQTSARIAQHLSYVTHWADMEGQEADFVRAAATQHARVAPGGGYAPLVCLLRGTHDDVTDDFIERMKDEFVALVQAQTGGALAGALNLGDRRQVAMLPFRPGEARGDLFARISALRYGFLKEMARTGAVPMPADRAAFAEALSGLSRDDLPAEAVVTVVPSSDFTKEDGALIQAWLADWSELVRDLRLPQPLVHVVYFEQRTEPVRAGFLSRLGFGGGDPFEDCCAQPAAEGIVAMADRSRIDWTHIANWIEHGRVKVQAPRVSPPEFEQFREHALRLFDTGAPMSVRDFGARLQTFEPPGERAL